MPLGMVALIIIGCTAASAEDRVDSLVSLLGNLKTRREAIEKIRGMPDVIPLLLARAETLPYVFEVRDQRIGLADAFGELKTKEAIPFLISNIGLQRWLDLNTWTKTAEVIEERLPAVGALVKIGRDAYSPLVHATWGQPLGPWDRVAVVFTLSRIAAHNKDLPDPETYFSSVIAEARMQIHWAEKGLRAVRVRP